jgi:hypothetical protein
MSSVDNSVSSSVLCTAQPALTQVKPVEMEGTKATSKTKLHCDEHKAPNKTWFLATRFQQWELNLVGGTKLGNYHDWRN